jgi:hypothetical protein
MKSEATVSQDRFRSIAMSKKLKNILEAYFNVQDKISLSYILSNFSDTFHYWAHEADVSYETLVKLIELNYNDEVNFEVSDKKISFGDEKYGSWIIFGSIGIFILWIVK